MDSGLLASLLRPDVVFTCRSSDEEKYDELEDAKHVAESLGLKHEVIEVTEEKFRKYLPEAVKIFGETTTHYNIVSVYLMLKKAKEMGMETVFSGEGADEILGGYPIYSILVHEQKLYDQIELKNYTYTLDNYLGTPVERFARLLKKPKEEVEKHWGKYDTLLSNAGYSDAQLRGILPMENALAKSIGVSLACPYADEALVKFCFEKIPDDLKIKDFTTKYIFRKVAEKYLSARIVWRKNKMGMAVPVGKWLGEEKEFDKDKYIKLQTEILKKL